MAQDSRVARVHPNHNVYILGAGFSRDAGLPLISDFLIRMRDSIGWLDEQNRKKELAAVENVFKFMLAATGTAYRVKLNVENIEELFSLASASGSDPLAKDVSTAIAATLDFARQSAGRDSLHIGLKDGDFKPPSTWESRAPEHPAKEAYVCSEYDIYAGLLSGKLCRPDKNMRNTVITFNYDTLLEDSLSLLNIPFNYGFDASSVNYHESALCVQANSTPDDLQVLKLHGSMNWADPLSSDGKIEIFGTYKDIRSNDRRAYLVPPTWRKVFGGGLTEVWGKAITALTEATRIIIIGFSMPSTDVHFKYLLAAGLRDNISLRKLFFINPAEDPNPLRENLFNIMRSELEDQGIIEYHQRNTKNLLMDKDTSFGLRYPKLFNREFSDQVTKIGLF